MRSHLEFRSHALLDSSDEAGPHGRLVAEMLAAELPGHGYEVERIVQDDWGWLVQIANPSFPLWIGCGRYEEYADGHLCFIEPSRPYVRRWLKLISTLQIVERLASALEKIVHDSGQATDLRWCTDTEVASGGCPHVGDSRPAGL